MTDDEKWDLAVCLQERAEQCAEQTKISEQELGVPKAEEVQSYFEEMTLRFIVNHGWPVMQIVVSRTPSSTVQSARPPASQFHFSLPSCCHGGSCRLFQYSLSIRGIGRCMDGFLIPHVPSSFRSYSYKNYYGKEVTIPKEYPELL